MNIVIVDFAQEYNIDPAIIQAILCVENADLSGIDYMGRPRIRFELHVFESRYTQEKKSMYDAFFRIGDRRAFNHYYKLGDAESSVHSSQENEHIALSIARVIDDSAALDSIGIGIAQIMGFNHGLVGYESSYDMYIDAFDMNSQYKMFTNYLKARTGLLPALSSLDYSEIARIYNGSSNIEAYSNKLIACYNKYKQ